MAGIVDDLRRIPMSDDLAQTLSRAAGYAQSQGHEQVQLEHLLLALAEDPDAIGVLAASHVDMALLFADVSQYLGGLAGNPPHATGALAVAPDLKRILEAAAAAASQGRRRDINGAIVLAAIVGDGRSPAAHMLRAQGLTFEEAIKALQRAMAQSPAPARPTPTPPVATDDLLASARARVQTRSGTIAPTAAEPPVAAATLPPGQPPPVVEDVTAQCPIVWPPDVRPATGLVEEPVSSPPFFASPYLDETVAGSFDQTPPANYDFEPEQVDHRGDYDPPGYGPEPPHSGTTMAAPVPAPPSPVLARPRPPLPQPGSRWPAPVAPAWRDDDAGQPFAAGSLPPPLPMSAPGGIEPQHLAPDRPPPNLGAAWPQQPEWHNPMAQAAPFEGDGSQTYAPPGGYASGASGHSLGPALGPEGPSLAPPSPAPAHPSTSLDGQEAVPTSHGRRRRKSSDNAARAMGEAIPRRMRVNASSLVEAQLPKTDIAAIAAGFAGGMEAGPAPTPPAMSVRLRAPDGGFLIDAASAETQWIDPRSGVIESEFSAWRWTVTPLKPGRRELQLIISIRAPGSDGILADQQLPDQVIEVRVRRGFGRMMLTMLKWIFVASLGAILATSGPQIFISRT